MLQMKRNSYSAAGRALVVVLAMLAAACRSGAGPDMKLPGDRVLFSASLHDPARMKTRGIEGLDSALISADKYNDLNFYIQLCTEGEAANTQLFKFGTYEIPSGYNGRLEPKGEAEALEWESLDKPHTFYAWTIPWEENWEPEGPEDLSKPVTVEFHNSAEGADYSTNRNNAVLERFIGSKSSTYTYNQHGKYVEMTFRHLVSKIKIDNMILVESNGTVQEHLKANITFVGMPTSARFYPHPQGKGWPGIDKTSLVYLPDDGVTYFYDNDGNSLDEFYICPEIDFSKINYQIKITNEAYKNKDIYYGTFDGLEFERKGVAFDDPQEQEGVITDGMTLHAGEMMSLQIVLIPGVGPGLKVVISGWSTGKPQNSEYHSQPGIYSDAELKAILDAFASQKSYDPVPEEIEWLFELYGEEKEGKKYFPLFENTTTDSNIFPVPKGYVLDGMGHTVTMKSNRGSNSHFGYTQTYFNIGDARDIYLVDKDNSNNSIYIDSEGYIWIYKDGQYVETGNQLEPLVDPYKSYDISCETGTVHRSTYYNNSITGS